MHLTHRSGQTLLELVIGVGIIVVTTLTTTTIIILTLTAGQYSQARVEAANLAREGAEVVRSLRDSNWLKIDQNVTDPAGSANPADLVKWDDNPYYPVGIGGYCPFSGGSGSCPNSGTLIPNFDPATGWNLLTASAGTGRIKLVDGLYYTQGTCPAGSSCTNSRFSRTVTIEKKTDSTITLGPVEYLDVTSTVTWQEKNGQKFSTVQTRLYDWK